MQNRPTLYDLWWEFKYFADVKDMKHLTYLEFFLEAKAGRFFESKGGLPRPILLSSLERFHEEIEKVAFIERLLLKEKINCGSIFYHHVLNALKTVNDGSPVYIGAFLAHLHMKNNWLTAEERSLYGDEDPYLKITANYSSSEEEKESSDEEQPSTQADKSEEGAQEVGEVAEDSESEDEATEETEVEGEAVEGRKSKFPDITTAPYPTSLNYSPLQVTGQQMRAKKRKSIRFEEPKAKKALKEDLEKKKAEGKEQKAILLTKILEDGSWEEALQELHARPNHVNTVNELIKRSKDYEEHSNKIMKAHQESHRAKESMIMAENKTKKLEKEKANLEVRMKELKGKLEIVEKEKTTALKEAKTKDAKIMSLQVQWIDRQEVEDKQMIVGNLRDEVQTILDAMKAVPMKDKKKTSFTQLAAQMKGDY
ncbi:hypothetical protein R1sor_022998 [Riccia sorocarpa]|uniref:Uncharacterized protein n=1 Tax=Riccia sorocarpa TaxID=122646 RepID=A0ABD3GLG4_9MARC